jgi:protein-S-isoprenylcysteine O-methyltransferase Ste14
LTRPLVYHAVVWRDVFIVTVAAAAIAELLIQVRTQAEGAADPSYKWMLLGSFAGVALAFALAGADGHLPGPGWGAAAAGIALMWAGLALRVWAVRTLGRFFTVEVSVESDQSLVDTGPYARIRHPSYTGLLVFYLGLGIALDSYLSAAAALLLPLAAVVNRIRHEERTLLRELGRPYRDYSERTDRLVPGVW